MAKKFILIFSVVAFCFSFSGCTSARQINEMAYVVGVGIDKGESEKILLSLQFAKPFVIAKSGEEGSGGDKEEKKDKSTSLATAEGADIFSAIKKIEGTLSKQINLTHTKILVFSKEISQDGISDYANTLMANNQFRPNTFVAMSLGKATEYFEEEKPALENNPAKYYTMMFSKDTKSSLPAVSLRDLYFSVSFSEREAVLPVLGGSVNEAMAVFRGDKLSFLMNDKDAEIYNILSGDFKEGYIVVSKEDGDYSVRLKQKCKPKICVKTDGEEIKAEIKLKASVKRADFGAGKEKGDIKGEAKAEILKRTENFLTKTYGEGLDVLGISRFAKKNFLSQNKWEDFGFFQKLNGIQIEMSADVKEENGGLIK